MGILDFLKKTAKVAEKAAEKKGQIDAKIAANNKQEADAVATAAATSFNTAPRPKTELTENKTTLENEDNKDKKKKEDEPESKNKDTKPESDLWAALAAVFVVTMRGLGKAAKKTAGALTGAGRSSPNSGPSSSGNGVAVAPKPESEPEQAASKPEAMPLGNGLEAAEKNLDKQQKSPQGNSAKEITPDKKRNSAADNKLDRPAAPDVAAAAKPPAPVKPPKPAGPPPARPHP